MKLQIYCIYDSKVLDYANPFYLHSEGELRRGFVEVCMNPETKMNKYPNDFSVYHIGEWNSESGIISSHPPALVMTAVEAIKQGQSYNQGQTHA